MKEYFRKKIADIEKMKSRIRDKKNSLYNTLTSMFCATCLIGGVILGFAFPLDEPYLFSSFMWSLALVIPAAFLYARYEDRFYKKYTQKEQLVLVAAENHLLTDIKDNHLQYFADLVVNDATHQLLSHMVEKIQSNSSDISELVSQIMTSHDAHEKTDSHHALNKFLLEQRVILRYNNTHESYML